MKRFLFAFAAVALGAVAVAASAGLSDPERLAAGATRTPLLGVNLIQYRFHPPYCWGNHILLDYHRPGVREEIVPLLHAMRAAGVETLRLQLVHMHGTTHWIPSDGGRVNEPYRTNLIRFLDDIRRAGFERVTIQFSPRGPNEPAGWFTWSDPGPYDPALFDENWGFIRDARALVKTYGPPSTHFDIYNEGAPGDWDLANKPWWGDYVVRLYRNYVDAFGNEDVTVSAVAKGMENFGDPRDDLERLQNLIDLLRASGKPLPTWFAVHPSWDARAVDDLRAVDALLTRNRLSQSLVISESIYEDGPVAAAIAEFMRTSTRPVAEVMTWPLYLADSVVGQPRPAQPRCATLPYRVDQYAKALRGGPPSRVLRGSVGTRGELSLSTPYGRPVKALTAGRWTLRVDDRSARHGFRLAASPPGGRFHTLHSGLGFRGTRTWTVRLQPGSYLVAADGQRTKRVPFDVLAPGG